jgi:hypothetical protein
MPGPHILGECRVTVDAVPQQSCLRHTIVAPSLLTTPSGVALEAD